MNNLTRKSICHVVSSLLVGGAERFVIDLCVEQRAQGMQPEIMSFGELDDPLVAVATALAIKVRVIKGVKGLMQFRLWRAFQGYSIIHFHSPAALKVALPILPFCLDRKIVYTRHGADPLASLSWRRVHQFARRYVDNICFVSLEGQQVFHQQHGWEHVASAVIDNGIAMPKQQEIVPHPQDGRLRIGSVGRMVALKHQISLLKALALLPSDLQKKIEVHFFGSGEQLPLLQQFTQQHLQQSEVVFHGLVSERAEIYNRFELLVVTSETEGMSLAIMEAMAYKRAVAATKVGGNPLLVEPEQTGYLFDYDDSQALAELLEQALANPEQVIALGERGRQRILTRFSLQRTLQQYQTIYAAHGTSL